MKIGITGASGHIGGMICRELLLEGHEVVALVRKSTKSLAGLDIQQVSGDVLDRDSLQNFMQGCDAIIHLAAIIGLGYKFDQKVYDINVTGTKNVLEIAKELAIKRVIHFSSIHIFKQKPYDIPLNETREFVDDNSVFYDQTKRDSHLLAQEMAKQGMEIITICPTGVIGPYDFAPSKLGKAIYDIYRGKFPAIVKGGFDFVDVRDVANGTINALTQGKSGETYILGGNYYTIKELADLIYKIKGKKKGIIELPLVFALIGLPFIQFYAFLTKKTPLYDKVYLDILLDGNKKIESKKAESELNYRKTDIIKTLTDTINWFKEIN